MITAKNHSSFIIHHSLQRVLQRYIHNSTFQRCPDRAETRLSNRAAYDGFVVGLFDVEQVFGVQHQSPVVIVVIFGGSGEKPVISYFLIVIEVLCAYVAGFDSKPKMLVFPGDCG